MPLKKRRRRRKVLDFTSDTDKQIVIVDLDLDLYHYTRKGVQTASIAVSGYIYTCHYIRNKKVDESGLVSHG